MSTYSWISWLGDFNPEGLLVPPFDETRIIVFDFDGLEEITGQKLARWHANVVGTSLWASGQTEALAWIALVAYWKVLLTGPTDTPSADPPTPPSEPKQPATKAGKRRRRRRGKK